MAHCVGLISVSHALGSSQGRGRTLRSYAAAAAGRVTCGVRRRAAHDLYTNALASRGGRPDPGEGEGELQHLQEPCDRGELLHGLLGHQLRGVRSFEVGSYSTRAASQGADLCAPRSRPASTATITH